MLNIDFHVNKIDIEIGLCECHKCTQSDPLPKYEEVEGDDAPPSYDEVVRGYYGRFVVQGAQAMPNYNEMGMQRERSVTNF